MSRIRQALERARGSQAGQRAGGSAPQAGGAAASEGASSFGPIPWTMPGDPEEDRDARRVEAPTPWSGRERRVVPRERASAAAAQRVDGPEHRVRTRWRELPPRPISEVVRPEVAARIVIAPDAPLVFVQQYRRLAGNLVRLRDRGDLRTLMITSADAGEGKTLTSANLALTLSESYRSRVLLVDGDVWRAGLNAVFDVPARAGLLDALSEANGDMISPAPLTTRLSFLPAGNLPGDRGMGLLNSPAMHGLLDDLRQAFDWVVVDMPPIAALPDARPLAEMFDAVLLVVGARQRPCAALEMAVEVIGRERIAGAVLNRAERVGTRARSQYDDYYRQNERLSDLRAATDSTLGERSNFDPR